MLRVHWQGTRRGRRNKFSIGSSAVAKPSERGISTAHVDGTKRISWMVMTETKKSFKKSTRGRWSVIGARLVVSGVWPSSNRALPLTCLPSTYSPRLHSLACHCDTSFTDCLACFCHYDNKTFGLIPTTRRVQVNLPGMQFPRLKTTTLDVCSYARGTSLHPSQETHGNSSPFHKA